MTALVAAIYYLVYMQVEAYLLSPRLIARAVSVPGAVVVIAAVVLFAVGAIQIVKAVKGSFLKHLEPQVASRPWARWSGRAGYAARGVVFILSSYFLLRAGLQEEAGEAGEIGDEGADRAGHGDRSPC